MGQRHFLQEGTFHVNTNTKNWIPWCTMPGNPEIIIKHLFITKRIYDAKIFAFSILPNHLHLLLDPGPRGLSKFMQSFKSNCMREINLIHSLSRTSEPGLRATVEEEYHWHNGFHDERIRDAKQRSSALNYVNFNAFKHEITNDPLDWKWSSLHFPELIDLMEIWFD